MVGVLYYGEEMTINMYETKEIIRKSKYPNMEIIPIYILDSQKNDAVNKAVYNLLQTFVDNNLSLHEIKGVLNRISDEVMNRAVMSGVDLKDTVNK